METDPTGLRAPLGGNQRGRPGYSRRVALRAIQVHALEQRMVAAVSPTQRSSGWARQAGDAVRGVFGVPVRSRPPGLAGAGLRLGPRNGR